MDQQASEADDDVSEFGTAECRAALREGRRPGERFNPVMSEAMIAESVARAAALIGKGICR